MKKKIKEIIMTSIRRFRIISVICSILLCTVFSSVSPCQVTPPEQFFGYKPGADFKLANYEEAMEYFDLISSQTGRMQMFDMGPTSEGRRMRYAIISSEENMGKLERYKEITRRLSLVRGVSKDEAEQLADEGKVVVWIDGGLHGSEVAPTQHLLQLAYDIVTGEDRKLRTVRDNVILLLVFANPDGMTIVSDWYRKNLGTEYEVSRLPVLYGRVGHDNNRDSMLANILETQNMNRMTCHEWFPEVYFNQHQTGPFPARIWIPPYGESPSVNKHPLVIRWQTLFGSAMGKSFDEAGQPGAISRVSYDSWGPYYVDAVCDLHNIHSLLTETQLYRYATPKYFTLNDFPEKFKDLTIGTFYPTPWQGGWWRLGDAVAYNLTASKSVLEMASKFSYDLLFDKWRMGNDYIEKFKNEPPYGWIIPAEQDNPHSTVFLINKLILLGAEVQKADQAFIHEGISYPEGTYILLTSQAFGNFVKNSLEIQKAPDLRKYPHLWQGIVSPVSMKDAAPIRPYDGVGWTYPLQMGIDNHKMSTPLDPNIGMTLITEAVLPPGTITGGGSQLVFSNSNNSFSAVNQILAAGGEVNSALQDFSMNGVNYPKGTFVVDGRSLDRSALRNISSETKVSLTGGNARVESKSLKQPRIAVYQSWVASMDAAWITLLFERYSFPYSNLTDAEIKAGDLRNRFDVIILPDQRMNSIINGHRKGTILPDYVGGITTDGVENIKTFVENGGTLICNMNSSDLAVEAFNLPVKNVLRGVSPDKFNCPGSILKMKYNTDDPLTFGLKKNGIAYIKGGPRVYEILPDSLDTREDSEKHPVKIAATYPDESLLISGWMVGDELIRKKASVLTVQAGEGNVILFGFNVQNRAQSHATFRLLFNAVYY
ncbi:MAG: hypothetical protein GY863_23885 [bacterium]|nr:hypothetical protein [bacterium]